MSRAHFLNLAILRTLERCGDYALPEDQLQTEACSGIRPPPKKEEYQRVLNGLRASGKITSIADDLDPALRKFVITEQGRAILARQP